MSEFRTHRNPYMIAVAPAAGLTRIQTWLPAVTLVPKVAASQACRTSKRQRPIAHLAPSGASLGSARFAAHVGFRWRCRLRPQPSAVMSPSGLDMPIPRHVQTGTTNSQDRHPEHSTEPEVRKPEHYPNLSLHRAKRTGNTPRCGLRNTDCASPTMDCRFTGHAGEFTPPEREHLKWWRV